jgi:ABC-type bacteriocin/lantibiotic exporter with double-glycine peptidase domain
VKLVVIILVYLLLWWLMKWWLALLLVAFVIIAEYGGEYLIERIRQLVSRRYHGNQA